MFDGGGRVGSGTRASARALPPRVREGLSRPGAGVGQETTRADS